MNETQDSDGEDEDARSGWAKLDVRLNINLTVGIAVVAVIPPVVLLLSHVR